MIETLQPVLDHCDRSAGHWWSNVLEATYKERILRVSDNEK